MVHTRNSYIAAAGGKLSGLYYEQRILRSSAGKLPECAVAHDSREPSSEYWEWLTYQLRHVRSQHGAGCRPRRRRPEPNKPDQLTMRGEEFERGGITGA